MVRKKLLLSYICITLLLVMTSSLFIYHKTQAFYIDSQVKRMAVEAQLLEDILNQMPLDEGLQEVYNYDKSLNIRISLISAEADSYGKVLVDTQYNENMMDNHRYREEIKAALSGKMGASTRHSSTLNKDYLYVATPIVVHDQAMVVRLAEPLNDVNLLNQHLIGMSALWLMVSLVAAVLVYYWTLKRLTKPLDEINDGVLTVAAGDYEVNLPIYEDPQFNSLAQSFNTMVAQQKQYIEGLQRKNVEMKAIFNSVGSGLVFLDQSQEIKLYNDLLVTLLALQKISLAGKKFFEVVHKTELLEQIEAAVALAEYDTQDIAFTLRGGKAIYRVTTAPVLASNSDKSVGLLLVIEDITQLKNLENVRREFVANVSHELKTPLTSIRGFIDTLKNGAMADPEVAERFLTIIDVEADRLYRMIQQLLYLSQIESTGPAVKAEVLDLVALAEEMTVRFAGQLSAKGLAMVSQAEQGLHYYGDKDTLMQIVINLLDNSIKYSQKGTITLTFAQEDDYLLCTLRDEGVGIAEADQARIFERFYRVEKSRAQKSGGTGLGLAIVKHLVESLHGSIAVESQLGEGSNFIVRLPNHMPEK